MRARFLTAALAAILTIGIASEAAAQAKAPSPRLKAAMEAAAAGDSGAESAIGGMYADGDGAPKNNAEAVRWYRLSAEHGNQWGQLNLGFTYAQGALGLKKDDVEALRLYRLCAAQGNAFCQQNIGAMYANGQAGLKQDHAEARRWFTMAADQGNPSAQYNIGMSYLRGDPSFPQSDAEAATWFRKVAVQADDWKSYPEPAVVRMVGSALYRLAVLEGNGRDVPRNAIEQRRHMAKAAELGIPEARAWLRANPG